MLKQHICFKPATLCTSRRTLAPLLKRRVRLSAGRDETPEQILERRLRESSRYEERVRPVFGVDDWKQQLSDAGNGLIVLEVEGEDVCQTGLEGDREDEHDPQRDKWGHVKVDVHSQAMEECRKIKHRFQRVARDCENAVFLQHTVDAADPSAESTALLDTLGVDVLPTLQFWKSGNKLYEHRGSDNMDMDISEGVLYYNGNMADGMRAETFVQELQDQEDVGKFAFAKLGEEKVLKVVVVSKTSSAPCMHMFPAVVALAQNFAGFASFSRIMTSDASIFEALKVPECPAFIMFSKGEEVGRYVGTSRTELICKILEVQQQLGVAPPPRPGARVTPVRQRAVRRV